MQVTSSSHDVLVRIHNLGNAIAPGMIASIFDPLVRFADPEATRPGTESSLGIGLYISRVIIEAHGGEIDVTSDADLGTTFSVRIPRMPPSAAAAPA